ncbi:hypothetical protein, partial [uncultured Gammaproteobacteria bacterium]
MTPAVSKFSPYQLASEIAREGNPKNRPSVGPATVPEEITS